MANLKKGAKGRPVNALQEALNSNGARPPLAVDGIFGPLTNAATKGYQKKKKLKVDGVVGEKTSFALGLIARPKSMDFPIKDLAGKRKEIEKLQSSKTSEITGALAKLVPMMNEVDRVKRSVEIIIAAYSKTEKQAGTTGAKAGAIFKNIEKMKDASKKATDVNLISSLHDAAEAAYDSLKDEVKEGAATAEKLVKAGAEQKMQELLAEMKGISAKLKKLT